MKCSDKEWQHCNKEKYGCEGCFYNVEISIGEYVRDIFGRIGQIYQYDHGTYRTKKFGASSGEIVKHSKDIIDLIEEGDYVNGCYCKRIPNFLNKMCNFDLNTMEWTPLENIDIWYNILTKEQYNANCFVVKE